MSLVRDPEGKLLFPGRVKKTLYEPFLPGGAFPSWLAAQAGTASFQSVSNGSGVAYARLATAATINAGARLWVPFDIRADMYTAVVWTLNGLRFDHDTPVRSTFRLELGNTGVDRGIALIQGVADTTATIRGYVNVSTFQDTPLNYRVFGDDGFSRQRRNITLAWLPQEGLAYVIEDDQVCGVAPVDQALKTSGIRAMLTFNTTEAVAHSFEFSGAELSLYHD